MGDLAETAFRRHYGQIYRYVRRRVPEGGDAEDVTQQVFVDAVRALDRFREGSPPLLAWLYTVAGRRISDERRRLARRPLRVADGGESRACASDYGPELAASLRRAMAALPEAQRRVLVMKLLEGRRFAEIAERLGASEGACKMRFLRALERVREQLEEEGIVP